MFRLSENNFRRFEPQLREFAERFPSDVVRSYPRIKPTTAVARLRDALIAWQKCKFPCSWNVHSLIQKRDKFFAYPTKDGVLLTTTKRVGSVEEPEDTESVDIPTNFTFYTEEELMGLCILVANEYILGPIVVDISNLPDKDYPTIILNKHPLMDVLTEGSSLVIS